MSKFSIADLQKIEGYWTDIVKLKKELKFKEWELLNPEREEDNNIGGGRSSKISDKTAQRAIILAEDKAYQNLKNIIETIESTYKELDEDQKKIVSMRYWDEDGCYEWQEIADELYISRNKALNKRNNLIDKTAKKLGWI